MGSARIVSVNTGGDKAATWAGQLGRTAIDKRPVASAVPGGMLGLAGDQQSDLVNHGGPDQAVYVYAREDLDWWEARLGRFVGSNIDIDGATARYMLIVEDPC